MTMTKAELIEALSDLPDEEIIYVELPNGEKLPIEDVDIFRDRYSIYTAIIKVQ